MANATHMIIQYCCEALLLLFLVVLSGKSLHSLLEPGLVWLGQEKQAKAGYVEVRARQVIAWRGEQASISQCIRSTKSLDTTVLTSSKELR